MTSLVCLLPIRISISHYVVVYPTNSPNSSPYQIAWEQYFTKYGGTDTLQALHLLFTKTPTSETWNFTHLHEVVLCILPLDLEETLQDCRYRSQINVRDSKGRTPLHWAAVRGDENAITLLLDHGAKINAQDEKQATPLLLAASSGTDRTLKLLILAGANVHLTDIRGGHALHYAARYQRETAPVKVLLQAGSPVDCRNIYGDTPFIAAAAKNNYEIGAYLLQKGADMHASNNLNDTPLFQSIYQNSHEFLELLLRKGVRYTSVNKSGSTILHAAALEADLLTISILSTSRLQGLCSSVLDKNGNTPLEIAKRRIAYPEGFQEAFEHLSSMLK